MAGDSGSPTPPGVLHGIHSIEPVGNQATTQSLARPPCFRRRLSGGCRRNGIEDVKSLCSGTAHTLPIDRMRPRTNTLAPHREVRGECMAVRTLEAMAKLDGKAAGQRGDAYDRRTEPVAPRNCRRGCTRRLRMRRARHAAQNRRGAALAKVPIPQRLQLTVSRDKFPLLVSKCAAFEAPHQNHADSPPSPRGEASHGPDPAGGF